MSNRSYQQNCALAIALDLIGERWTLLIVRELLIRERRFGELQQALPGIGSNLLSARLARLCELGLVERRSVDGGHPDYRLTDTGRELEPAVQSLVAWAMQFTALRRDKPHTRAEWSLLPLRASWDPESMSSWVGSIALTLDGDTTWLFDVDGELQSSGSPREPVQAEICLSSETAARMTIGELSVDQALDSGLMELTGDRGLAHRFLAAASG